MIYRAFRYKMKPTPEQSAALAQTAGTVRFVYNLALEQRRTFWRQYKAATGGRLNYISQGRELTQLRAEVDWIRAAHGTSLTQALRDLDRAFAAFLSGRARFPTPRRRGVNDSFRFKGTEVRLQQVNGKWAAAAIPKIGWVKFRLTRPILGSIRNATVCKRADGWFISFASEIDHDALPSALPGVGIDRGIANTIALSTGELLTTPATARLERRKRKAQRVLARRQRGSNRYRKQRGRVARLAAKISDVRADWRHKATLGIVRRFGMAAIEALPTTNMARAGKGRAKRGLNRSIHEQGWYAFEAVLAYKLEDRGGSLVKVNPAYTSQTCSDCGAVDSRSRESQARFVCTDCGFATHADTNAAINILRRSTALMRVEDGEYPAVEARTVNHALAA